ncbi:MAG: hypothetical protein EBT07_08730 [Actinobacteria bacterium]|nr:hypothetical protein [Actinomycetota bacterium]
MTKNCLKLIMIVSLSLLANRSAWAQGASVYVVYAQSFSETRITDGVATPSRTQVKYLTLTEYDGNTSRNFRTWQLSGRKTYLLYDDTSVTFTCSILNQGSKKMLVSYWDSLPAGRHFSWSTGLLKPYSVAGQTVQLASPVQTKGVGVPMGSDTNFKEYSSTGTLDLPATQYVNAQNPADDDDAAYALMAYYTTKGFTFLQ